MNSHERRCDNCDNEIYQGHIFCYMCGYRLNHSIVEGNIRKGKTKKRSRYDVCNSLSKFLGCCGANNEPISSVSMNALDLRCCQNCNSDISQSQRFCDNCGHRTSHSIANGSLCTGTTLYGTPCYNVINSRNKFCGSCGTNNDSYIPDTTIRRTAINRDNSLLSKHDADTADKREPRDIDSDTAVDSSSKRDCTSNASLHRAKFVNPEDKLEPQTTEKGPFTSAQIAKENVSTEPLSSIVEQISKGFLQERKKNNTNEVNTAGNKHKSDRTEKVDQNTIEKPSRQITKDKLEEMLKTQGASVTSKYIDELLMRCKTQTVNLAVAGRTSTGKSTFINTMRGCNKNDHSFAKPGTGNTTRTVGSYPHPHNRRICFYDLPGYGSTIMTKKEFLEEVDIREYDYFFILFNSSISEDDEWFAQEITINSSPFCFVRTMLDQNLSNAKRDGIDERTIITRIRQDYEKSIKKNINLRQAELFVVSNIKLDIGEMSALFDHMMENLSEIKAETILQFIPLLTQNVIERKYEELKRRVPFVAFKASAMLALPIPVLDISLNMNNEVKCYIESFQLNSSDTKDIPGVKDKWLTENIGKLTTTGLKPIINSLKTSYCAEYKVTSLRDKNIFASVIVSSLSAYFSYQAVTDFLMKTLDEIKNDAFVVYHYRLKTNKCI